MSLRILLVDDHTVLRSGLRLLLQTQPDLLVVGDACDAETGLALMRDLRPDLMVLDLSMPGMSGLEMLQRVKAEMPDLKIVVLTMHDDAEYLRSALMHGASGYILKKAADSELLDGLRRVAAGETYVYPSLAMKLVKLAGQRASSESPGKLSARELEVLQLIARGYTQQEISVQLCVSIKTVETHRSKIGEKLGLRTRAQLVRYALENGLVITG